MKAWLVTWEWDNDAAAIADAIATVLNPNLGEETVARIVEVMYANATSEVSELAAIAKHPAGNPYRAQRENGRITCGHNPYLWARPVEDLEIVRDSETDLEVVTWIEPGPWQVAQSEGLPDSRQGPSRRATCVRLRSGPVSHEPVWDRSRGAFKQGWSGHQGVLYSEIEAQ